MSIPPQKRTTPRLPYEDDYTPDPSRALFNMRARRMAKENQPPPPKPIERRRGIDFWARAIPWTILISWLLLMVAFGFVDFARPEQITLFDRTFGVIRREVWDRSMAQWGIILFCITFVLSILGLAINTKRMRRKTDRIRFSLIIAILVSAVGAVLLFVTVSPTSTP